MSCSRFALGLLLMTFAAQGCATTVRPSSTLTQIASAPKPEQPIDTVALRAKLAKHRTAQLEQLQTYAEAGVFPQNLSRDPAPIHMFRDSKGTLCAVANLLHQDGLDPLVNAMVQTHNDVVVADEPSGALHEWVLTSGLTNEEVRRIQGPGFTGGTNEMMNEPTNLLINRELTRDQKVQAYLRTVLGELTMNTESSLEIATARLAESPLARQL